MVACLEKNVYLFVCVVLSHLVLREGCGVWLGNFLSFLFFLLSVKE